MHLYLCVEIVQIINNSVDYIIIFIFLQMWYMHHMRVLDTILPSFLGDTGF
jgi:hypothetical protein